MSALCGCDLCGAAYSPDPKTCETYKIGERKFPKCGDTYRQLDLCPDCYSDLIEFVVSKRRTNRNGFKDEYIIKSDGTVTRIRKRIEDYTEDQK